MRRATRSRALQNTFNRISIHALHEESDQIPPAAMRSIGISIHALHEESDIFDENYRTKLNEFQSTLSMRRATQPVRLLSSSILISIHALHEESDTTGAHHRPQTATFQSTLSMRRATDPMIKPKSALTCISIHALHEESDTWDAPLAIKVVISIHALHEESDGVSEAWR